MTLIHMAPINTVTARYLYKGVWKDSPTFADCEACVQWLNTVGALNEDFVISCHCVVNIRKG